MCLKPYVTSTTTDSSSVPLRKTSLFYKADYNDSNERLPLLRSGCHKESNGDVESSLAIVLQVLGPFLLAGIGVVFTGLSLDYIQHWPVFITTPQLVILIPSLLGLKGNLEMTLASRLSTQVNLGVMNCRDERIKLIKGNMSLLLCQGIVVGFLAAVLALGMNYNNFTLNRAYLTCASSMLTAVVACLILGSITIAVVFGSHMLKINPDNVAAPLASAFGDVTTLWLLALCSTMLKMITHSYGGDYSLLLWLIGFFLIISPILALYANYNTYTHQVLREVWVPIICAIGISSISGLVLSVIMKESEHIALFQPVINGIGGNLVAVQASRLSTFLHKQAQNETPFQFPLCFSPFSIFSPDDINGKSAFILLLIGIPGHALFMGILFFSKLYKADHDLSAAFFLCYIFITALQVFILLYLAQILVGLLWRLGLDPDNAALPFLTALGDFLGTCLLAIAFYIT